MGALSRLHQFRLDQAPRNLGAALMRLGARASDTARLEEGVAAYREALMEYTRGRISPREPRTR